MAEAAALWVTGPGRCELRRTELPALAPGHVRVRAKFSGISRGTERLVFESRVPSAEYARMRAPFQDGDLPGPVKYGYCMAGTIEAGDVARIGENVFVLHPHQDLFDVPADAALPLPANLTLQAAPLAAHLETALNALWDHPARIGDRVAIVGLGAVGLCLAKLLAPTPGIALYGLDPSPAARARGGLRDDCPGGCHLVFHCSGSEAGLAQAIELAGFEATIVEMSWYGSAAPRAPLGGAFHSQRLTLAASQVGSVAAARRAHYRHGARLALALRLLAEPAFRIDLGAATRFADLPADYARLLAAPDDSPLPLVAYGDADV
jgi:threonine dehydrogenase-like Zn-dependent dehydrogenase